MLKLGRGRRASNYEDIFLYKGELITCTFRHHTIEPTGGVNNLGPALSNRFHTNGLF